MNSIFVFRTWMRTLFTWIGIAAMFYGGNLIYSGDASPYWLLLSYAMAQVFMFTLSVGNHRLFSHRSFETNVFWKWFFAITSVVSGNGSAYTWTFIHIGHHKLSDTPKDPYETNFHYFFRHKHKAIEYDIPKTKWLLKETYHRVTHKYSVLWVLGFAALALLISPKLLVFGYLIPASFHHITGGLLIIFTHDKNGPTDRPWWIGLLIPSAGEWYHRSHHEAGQARRLNNAQSPMQFDSGYWFAKLISKK